jgi:hypothetical protein
MGGGTFGWEICVSRFLSPDIVEAVLNGSGGFGLRNLRKCAALKWRV